MKRQRRTNLLKGLLPLLFLGLGAQSVNASVFRFLSPKYNTPEPQRVLTGGSFGGYVITTSPPPASCPAADKITFDDAKFEEGMKSLTLFSGAREAIEKFAKNGQQTSELTGTIGKIVINFVPSALGFILSMLMFWVFVLYFLCNCLCRCCCKAKTFNDFIDQPGDSEKKRMENEKGRGLLEKKIKEVDSGCCIKCLYWSSLILVGALMIMGIVWISLILSSASGLTDTSCSIHYTFERIKRGTKSPSEQFAGLLGMKYLVQSIIDSLTQVNTAETIFNNVIG